MQKNNEDSFFERIRQKCRQRNCYGSDADYMDMEYFPLEDVKIADEYWYDQKGKHKVGRKKQLRRHISQMQRYALLYTRFTYPPATEAQLHTTEEMLGFSLPGTLHALYAQVANGGFGPNNGIIGAKEGHASRGEDAGKNIADVYHKRRRYLQYVNLALDEEQLAAERKILLPWEIFPTSFFLLCGDGGHTKTYIDANMGRIFEEYIDSGEYRVLYLKASSLEEWLELWLKEWNEPILPKFSTSQRNFL